MKFFPGTSVMPLSSSLITSVIAFCVLVISYFFKELHSPLGHSFKLFFWSRCSLTTFLMGDSLLPSGLNLNFTYFRSWHPMPRIAPQFCLSSFQLSFMVLTYIHAIYLLT